MVLALKKSSPSKVATSSIRQVIVVASTENMDAAWQLIRYRNPEAVSLIGPHASVALTDEFKKSLLGVPTWRRCETGRRNIQAIYRRLKQHRLEVPGPSVEFCLNSGPIAVKLAAMQWAREIGARVSYLSLSDRIVLDVNQIYPSEDVDGRLTLFLESRGSQLGTSSAPLAERHIGAAEFLARNLQDWHEVITWLRLKRDRSLDGEGSVPLVAAGPLTLNQAQLEILRKLKEKNIVGNLQTESDRLEVHFVSEAERKFVNGIWLEVFVYSRIQELFDDCRYGQTLRLEGNLREVDFIGLARGKLTLVSCKTSLNPFDVKHLQELQEWSGQLERLECARFFVTDSSGHNRTDSSVEFEAFAESRGIVVVQGDNLQQIQDIVSQEMHH